MTAAPAESPPSSPAAAAAGDPIEAWLLAEGRYIPRTRELIEALCQRLVEAGMPLWRIVLSIRTIHPQILSTVYYWLRDADSVVINRGHDIVADPIYLNSPFKVIHDGAGALRRRLAELDSPLDYPVLEELKTQGGTDYVAMPLTFTNGTVNAVSWASDAPGGFRVEDLKRIDALLPILALILEVQNQRRTALALLDTYLGHRVGERILGGEVTRGSGQTIHAVIWSSDLRGFTQLSHALPLEELIAMLNDYFERMVAAIQAHGGEVLKFIGDGLLAIFPLGDAAFQNYVARTALNAAAAAERAVDELNRARVAAGKPAIRYGVALHIGDFMFGNIGAPDRLDFTVVGPAVNLTARLEALTVQLERRLLVSAAFARAAGRPLISLGRFPLRGFDEPQEVFGLPEAATDAAGEAAEVS
jgi:adenylate cyclase